MSRKHKYPQPEIEEFTPTTQLEPKKIKNVLWYITINSNRELDKQGAELFRNTIDELFYHNLYLLFRVINPEEATDPNGLINLDDVVRQRVSRYFETGTKVGRFHVHILVRLSHTVPSGVTMRIDELKESLKARLGYTVYIKPKVHSDAIENLEQYIYKTAGVRPTPEQQQEMLGMIMADMK